MTDRSSSEECCQSLSEKKWRGEYKESAHCTERKVFMTGMYKSWQVGNESADLLIADLLIADSVTGGPVAAPCHPRPSAPRAARLLATGRHQAARASLSPAARGRHPHAHRPGASHGGHPQRLWDIDLGSAPASATMREMCVFRFAAEPGGP